MKRSKVTDYAALKRVQEFLITVKPVQNGHSQKDHKLIFKNNYHLMQVKSIAECSKGSIMQYFRPSLSYHFILSVFEWLFYTGFTVHYYSVCDFFFYQYHCNPTANVMIQCVKNIEFNLLISDSLIIMQVCNAYL